MAAWLNQKIKQGMKTQQAELTDLVFAALMARVNAHLLHTVKRVAKRSGSMRNGIGATTHHVRTSGPVPER